jgi:hypothetical protein
MKSGNLHGTPEWDWANGRLEDLRHFESMSVKEATGTVYVLNGPGERAYVNSTDNSTNTIAISEADVFPKLRSELNAIPFSPATFYVIPGSGMVTYNHPNADKGIRVNI